MKRRAFIGTSAAATVGLMTVSTASATPLDSVKPIKFKGNINHSVCRWCYNGIPLEEFLQHLNTLGMNSIDLVGPEDWPLMKKIQYRRFHVLGHLQHHP